MVYCESCGREIPPEALYCYYCGQQAPKRTVLGRTVVYENPVYCPACGARAPEDALYCGGCGAYLFERPADDQALFCPWCAEKNGVTAEVCNRCGRSLASWFRIEGKEAEKRGYTGNLSITETMSQQQYHFLLQPRVSLGREPDNDIVIPCSWISGHHATFDVSRGLLRDNRSANGTYVNRSDNRVSEVPMSAVWEFNLAGSFTFVVTKEPGAFIFRLGAILDEDQCAARGDRAAFDELRTHYYILMTGDVDLVIRKMDGVIDKDHAPREECYQVTVRNGFYYYTDTGRQVQNRLLLKDKTGWPVNWKAV